MAERGEGRHVQSVVKALEILDCLARQRRPMTLGELSQAAEREGAQRPFSVL